MKDEELFCKNAACIKIKRPQAGTGSFPVGGFIFARLPFRGRGGTADWVEIPLALW